MVEVDIQVEDVKRRLAVYDEHDELDIQVIYLELLLIIQHEVEDELVWLVEYDEHDEDEIEVIIERLVATLPHTEVDDEVEDEGMQVRPIAHDEMVASEYLLLGIQRRANTM